MILCRGLDGCPQKFVHITFVYVVAVETGCISLKCVKLSISQAIKIKHSLVTRYLLPK